MKSRRTPFAFNELVQLAKKIRISSIMTPEDQLICVRVDASIEEALKLAAQGPFDQLPVRNREGEIMGLVWTAELQEQSPQDSVSIVIKDFDAFPLLSVEAGLNEALSAFSEFPARLVAAEDKIVGLIHRSDFNKHPARTYFYLWLSAMEMGLARFIKAHFSDDSWIALLSEGAQIQILGKIEVERRRNNELDPIEYADLSDLVRVVSKSKDRQLWHDLGFNSRNEWEEKAGGLVELRHAVMHPVRTLVSDADSVSSLIKRGGRLRSMVERIHSALESGKAQR